MTARKRKKSLVGWADEFIWKEFCYIKTDTGQRRLQIPVVMPKKWAYEDSKKVRITIEEITK